MKPRVSDLIRWDGQISRTPFLLWAAVLFAVKYNLDRLLLRLVFHRDWSLLSYFDRPVPWIEGLSPARNPAEFAVLLAVSVPFLWFGVVLCLKRLRSACLPLWLAVLFVVPILKWFLFVTLALVPERPPPGEERTTPADRRKGAWLPASVVGSAALAVGISVLLALCATALSTKVLREYGWSLFAGVPFSMGFLAAILHGTREPRSARQSLMVAFAAVALAGAACLALAFEGVICLLMAAPLAFALAAVGALAGHAVQANRWRRTPPQAYLVPLLALPLMLGTESLRQGPPPLFQVVTAVEVDAPVERVWRNVVSFAELPPPRELLFRLGVAYPVRAEIHGRGVGAVRHCCFSTGTFVEPMQVWDEPRLLRFSVTQDPAPMEEWTPYRHVHPPHLDGFLVSRQGQFLLTPLPGGRTRLEGTTWYHHTMWPANYWRLWSDHIIHTIHLRVLDHVKELSEREPLPRPDEEPRPRGVSRLLARPQEGTAMHACNPLLGRHLREVRLAVAVEVLGEQRVRARIEREAPSLGESSRAVRRVDHEGRRTVLRARRHRELQARPSEQVPGGEEERASFDRQVREPREAALAVSAEDGDRTGARQDGEIGSTVAVEVSDRDAGRRSRPRDLARGLELSLPGHRGFRWFRPTRRAALPARIARPRGAPPGRRIRSGSRRSARRRNRGACERPRPKSLAGRRGSRCRFWPSPSRRRSRRTEPRARGGRSRLRARAGIEMFSWPRPPSSIRTPFGSRRSKESQGPAGRMPRRSSSLPTAEAVG